MTKPKHPFNEAKALEIITLWDLSSALLRIWRTRGFIPAHYFNSKPEIKTKIAHSHTIQLNSLLEICKLPEINASFLSEHTFGNKNKLIDVIKKKSTLYEQEFIQLKTTINALKIQLKTINSQRTLKKAVKDNLLIKPFRILNRNRKLNYRLTSFCNDKTDLSNSEFQQIANCFVIFVLKLRI